MQLRFSSGVCGAAMCVVLFVAPAMAELRPDEIGILSVRGNRESQAVAAYYAKVRSIPTENVLSLSLPAGETLSREDWQAEVRPTIRRWLAEQGRRDKLRCLVTVWDVPLRIAAAVDDPQVTEMLTFLREDRRRRVEQVNDFLHDLHQLAGLQTPIPNLGPDTGLPEIKAGMDEAFGAAQKAVVTIEDETGRTEAMTRLQTIYVQMVGLNMIAQSLGRQIEAGGSEVAAKLRPEFDFARGRTIGLREGRAALEGTPYSLDREPQLLTLIQVSDGLYGTLAWIDEQISTLSKNESYASFDSELSLVDLSEHTLIRWLPNYLHYRFDGSPLREFRKTYMVSRLEAPTLKLTREIIDKAIEVEQSGLQGKVYLDARGITQSGFVEYDQSLIEAARLIQEHTNLDVVLDEKQSLFQPGEAVDAAVYIGWYSLAHYVDAFSWAPGAVGYHMASAEAKTLRDPESQAWCKRMLEEGVVATLGPVEEPYISAFPPPYEFCALLLSGKYTLAEVYYRCVPSTSWTMTLIGDPLYAPYRTSPPLRIDELDDRTRRVIGDKIWSAATRRSFSSS